LIVLFLLEGPKTRQGLLELMRPGTRDLLHAGGKRDQPVGDRLRAGQPPDVADRRRGRLRHAYRPRGSFPLLWALWVALVDFLPMVGGALAGIPTVLFALGHSVTAGIVTAAAFIAYQQIENHVLNSVVMSRTVRVNPLLVLLSLLIGTSIGDWIRGSSAVSWPPCSPSRSRTPFRSSPGNYGRPPRGRAPDNHPPAEPGPQAVTSKHPRPLGLSAGMDDALSRGPVLTPGIRYSAGQ
jgi:hypothetical protein